MDFVAHTGDAYGEHSFKTVPNEEGGSEMEIVQGMYTTAKWGYVVR